MASRDARRTRILLSDVQFRVHRGLEPGIVEAAGALMRATWPPPSLDYSPELLQWQLTFPGDVQPLAVTGWIGERCVAFAGATPRSVCTDGWEGRVLLKSFMTVAADLKGQGIGRRLRTLIVREAGASGDPILRFGEASQASGRALVEDYTNAGMHVRMLGACSAAATVAKGGAPAPPLSASEFALLWSQHPRVGVINPLPQEGESAHYARDPRQRVVLGVRDADDRLVAGAMVVRAAIAGRRGVEPSVQFEQLAVTSEAEGSDVARLASDAAHWGYAAGSGVVTIPNIGDTPWPLLAAAGFRKLAPRYSVWGASRDPSHPILEATATNIEIV